MRPIDADAMIDRLKKWDTKDKIDKALYNFTLSRIIEQPTIHPSPKPIKVFKALPSAQPDHNELNLKCDGCYYHGKTTASCTLCARYYPDLYEKL